MDEHVTVTVNGEPKFNSELVTECTIVREYDGVDYTTTVTIHHTRQNTGPPFPGQSQQI